jgi:hypothetical protein
MRGFVYVKAEATFVRSDSDGGAIGVSSKIGRSFCVRGG